MNKTMQASALGVLFFFGITSCASKKEQEGAEDKSQVQPAPKTPARAAPMKAEAPEMEEAAAPVEDSVADFAGGYRNESDGDGRARAKRQGSKENARGGGEGGPGAAEQGPAPRAWFPETFLFEPLVITDEQGRAEVSMRVPDRLTTWRVLGLAHSRSGAQAGATASFAGTLPAYVDPVVPESVRVGDILRVPVQLINNSDKALQTSLSVQVEGGTLRNKGESISLPAQSSTLRYAEITADTIGTLRFMARMGEQDMVVRDIQVLPTGRPVRESHSGTLAAARTITTSAMQSVSTSTGTARLSVYPGALALLRSELGASLDRGGMAADAFALGLAGNAPELLQALGDEPDLDALRALKITATQKLMQHARVLDINSATLIARAAGAHPFDPVLERLAKRAFSTIESGQSPDGTCGGQDGLTLQRLLVQTADCARAADGAPNVTIRAAGAFERHAKEISDPYTAAAILAADAATGALAESLRALVLEAIEERESGAKVVRVPPGVLRADGHVPTEVEATALAILALRDVKEAPLADLGATLLASYQPSRGWGDGRTNLVCMEAVLLLFRDPLPETIAITLKQDGQVVAEGTLTRDKVREVLELSAEGLDLGGDHNWQLSAEPAVPGLGFSLALTSWVPWQAEQTLGTELVLEMPKNMSAGKAAMLGVQALAPSGIPFSIELQLPAGALVDSHALDKLVQAQSLSHYQSVDGRLTLHVRPLAPAQRFTASIPIIPTLGGRLQSGATAIEMSGQRAHLPPTTWVVR